MKDRYGYLAAAVTGHTCTRDMVGVNVLWSSVLLDGASRQPKEQARIVTYPLRLSGGMSVDSQVTTPSLALRE